MDKFLRKRILKAITQYQVPDVGIQYVKKLLSNDTVVLMSGYALHENIIAIAINRHRCIKAVRSYEKNREEYKAPILIKLNSVCVKKSISHKQNVFQRYC